MKQCNRCEQHYISKEFLMKKNKMNFTDERSPTCTYCVKSEKAKHTDPDRVARTTDLLRDYGMTIEDYEDRLKKQNGRCSICKSDKPKGRGKGVFHIDHNHATGQIRSILCVDCNIGLGMFQDSIKSLFKAITYLLKHKFLRS